MKLERTVRLPTDPNERNNRYADMRTRAHLSASYNAFLYDYHAVPIRVRDGDFFTSAVFMTTVHFNGPNRESYVMEENIFCSDDLRVRPVVLKRSLFDTRSKTFVFEEYLPDSAGK